MVRANHLWGGNNCNEYQDHLYDLISNKLDDGWNYQQIADCLNENGITTVRGKSFRNAHTHSIVKKRLRDARMGKEYEPEYSNFQVRFVDRTLINDI